MFKVKILLAGKSYLADTIINEVRNKGSQDHEDSHSENPNNQFAAHCGISHQSKSQESDQGDTGNTVCFKTISGRTNAVTRIVARTVGNNTGIFRVIFGKMENYFHQVGADIGNLGEDTTADTQSGSTQRFTDGKTDKAGSGQFFGNVSQNDDHKEKFNTDQEKSNAHTGTQTDVDDIHGIAAQ